MDYYEMSLTLWAVVEEKQDLAALLLGKITHKEYLEHTAKVLLANLKFLKEDKARMMKPHKNFLNEMSEAFKEDSDPVKFCNSRIAISERRLEKVNSLLMLLESKPNGQLTIDKFMEVLK